ncbi:alpha/beta hydrolase, partial [Paenarthrobacter sp. CM16]|uniref:alpha/beta fold hydrolase n=1 Tax=Paenarthrobacter sp. CM16 TaxID=2738447 RepID=UPI001554DDC6
MRQYEVQVRMGSVAVDAYSLENSAEIPLVLLPGIMSDATAWSAVAGPLSADRAVHVVNRRGRHPSTDLPAGYSLRTEIEDLIAVLGSIARPAHLFGWSLGALVALEAVAAGAGVKSLILYEPVMAPFGKEQTEPLRTAREHGDYDAMVEIVNRDISGYSQAHVENLRTDQATWEHLLALAIPLADEIEALNAFTPHLEGYDSIAKPVTVLRGSESGLVYEAPCTRAIQALNRPMVVSLQGQDHLI